MEPAPLPDPSAPAVDPSRPVCPPAARPFILIAAILASSMGFIDGSIVSLAMPAIRADLGAGLAEAQWIINSYLLFLATLVLVGGAAGDSFGVRNVFLAGIGAFMAASLACALAPDPASLIAMRALKGVAAAIMIPGSLAIIAKSWPARERGRAIGIWAAASSLTTAMGPFAGGLVLSFGADWMWRLLFAINVPIGIVAIALLLARAPADRPDDGRRLDLVGALLATCGLGALAWGLTAFGLSAEHRIASPWLWIAAGGMLLVAFVAWERRVPDPMIPLALFASPAFSGANLYTFLLFFGFNGLLFFLPMTLISAWNVAEWQVSLLFLPLSLFIGLLSASAGRFADRFGPRLPLTVGAVLTGLSYAAVAMAMPLMRLWDVLLPILMLQALGMAMLVSPLSTAVMTAASDSLAGTASGVNNAVARAAGTMSIAALGAIAAIVYAMAGGPESIGFGAIPQSGETPAGHAARVGGSNAGFQVIAAISAAMCLAAAVVAWVTQPSWKKGAAPAGVGPSA